MAQIYIMKNIFDTFKNHTIEFYTSLYKTYVRPILESSSPVWSPNLKFNIENIESVQRYFTRRLPGLKDLSYENRLNVLNLDTLESRRLKADIILCYKYINNYTIIDMENSITFYKAHRGHEKHLFTHYSRTDIRKYFWSNRIVKIWNNLSSEIINFKISKFKKAITNLNLSSIA